MLPNQNIINEQEDDVGFIANWYVYDISILGVKIEKEVFERAEELLKKRGIPLYDDTYAAYGYNLEEYDTNTFLWNGAITYCQRSTEQLTKPLTLANNQGVITRQRPTRPTHIITIVAEHEAKVKNTAYRLRLPLEDRL